VITLRPKRLFKVPVDAECITPDIFSEKTPGEITRLEILEGNRRRILSELFKIQNRKEEGDPQEETAIRIHGDLSRVRRIGARMSMGTILIEGNVGMHLGEEMTGGTITVTGDADSWAGSMMKNGTIEIKGNAGDYIGAPYRGSRNGMRGGMILIHRSARNEVGCFMRKGLIKVYQNVGQFAGIHMRNGTILILGDSHGRAGAGMTGGKIVIRGHIPSILPTFTIDSVKTKVKVDTEEVIGPFYRFIGDLADFGTGKLFVSQTENPQFKSYEQYL
jgi:formylmethanofuran dehydrogenase subunit C